MPQTPERYRRGRASLARLVIGKQEGRRPVEGLGILCFTHVATTHYTRGDDRQLFPPPGIFTESRKILPRKRDGPFLERADELIVSTICTHLDLHSLRAVALVLRSFRQPAAWKLQLQIVRRIGDDRQGHRSHAADAENHRR